MAKPRNTRDQILDVAEGMIRDAGFNAFSAREIANTIGVKSASIHYHFPTKADIGVAVTERYTQRFMEALGDPSEISSDVAQVVSYYIDFFRRALVRDKQLCLCVVLGAESGGIPEPVGRRTQIFFERNLQWLKVALDGSNHPSNVDVEAYAALILSSVEGALVISMSLGDRRTFERVASSLLRLLDRVAI